MGNHLGDDPQPATGGGIGRMLTDANGPNRFLQVQARLRF
jgi:hypothetical protein